MPQPSGSVVLLPKQGQNGRTFKNLHGTWLLDYGTEVTKTSLNLLHDLPTLEYRRLETQLCLLYSTRSSTNCACIHYFDQNTFTVSTTLSHYAPHNLVLNCPFARTNSYFYSFVPQSILYWIHLLSVLLLFFC